ncbi:uncharacterized protein LOC126906088 isoform X2 [Daktulosphaira vitifoliae]|uniref:uncharacterized protein LOC126906088 isoform X2 n=1 Tax=Daktulosphaira vitifoliae TaxID=58002 RepID=UPI0021AA2FA3|nr:uncharacterized protein LOC126906088 isoform X2 [Daktulosphaira vitifoliae]
MPGKVYIENHLEDYLKTLTEEKAYIPGLIIGQVIGDTYHVVHLTTITTWNENKKKNVLNILKYTSLLKMTENFYAVIDRASEVINLLPGGSYVLGLFFILPQDLNGIQPVSVDFSELDNVLNEFVLFKNKSETWKYLLLNFSTVNKKSYCYTVDINNSNNAKSMTYKSIDVSFQSSETEWINFVGTFNFGTLDSLNVTGGLKVLSSIRENLLDQLESILERCVFTFNGKIYDKKTTLTNLLCETSDNSLKNVVHVELFKEIESGDDSKNASIKIIRGKGKIVMSGLCSLAVPFHKSGFIEDATKAIHQDAIRTFATRLRMHLESFVEEESEEEEIINVVHETPRRILILKTEGCKFAFSDYVFPGEIPQEAFNTAGEILNLPEDKMELYTALEKGRTNYESSDIDDSQQDIKNSMAGVTPNSNSLFFFIWATIIFAIISFIVKQLYI